jgi:hypothetical protein
MLLWALRPAGIIGLSLRASVDGPASFPTSADFAEVAEVFWGILRVLGALGV